jgi:hypothetical protein
MRQTSAIRGAAVLEDFDMAKHFIIGAAALVLAGAAIAGTMTETTGNSTSTITQQGGGVTKREVIKTPDGQIITQETGGSKATVVQRTGPSAETCAEAREKATDDKAAKSADAKSGEHGKPSEDAKTAAAADLCAEQASEPGDLGPGFERAQALRERMDAMRRQ